MLSLSLSPPPSRLFTLFLSQFCPALSSATLAEDIHVTEALPGAMHGSLVVTITGWTKPLKIPAGKVEEGAEKRVGAQWDFHIKGQGSGSGMVIKESQFIFMVKS